MTGLDVVAAARKAKEAKNAMEKIKKQETADREAMKRLK